MFLQLVLGKHSQEWQITFRRGKTNSTRAAISPSSTHLFQTVHSGGNPDDVKAACAESLATLIGPVPLIDGIFPVRVFLC